MGNPALAMGDKVMGTCPNHLVPAPSGTAPAGPLPFSAPLSQGTVGSVLIRNKPAAVVGSSGVNAQPHVGIVDGPFASPTNQVGRIVTGSATVFIGGKPAATTVSACSMCATPATAVGPGAPNVLIG